jgi:pimeloyl-ACP methyl ester carboxylesterase/DNA-binding winged helix-turn-helix (wHTH) protein
MYRIRSSPGTRGHSRAEIAAPPLDPVAMPAPSAPLHLGGAWIEPAAGRIRAPDGRTTILRAQSAAVLRVLACRCGDAVSKDALFDQVWGGIAVTGDSLVQCIGEIRSALGGAREVVRALPGFGYMLAEPPAPQITDAEPIRFVIAPDGVHIAWRASGRGVPLLKAPNWISHLSHERRSRLYAPFFERLGRVARIVRLDQRGNGMSDWDVPPLSVDAMVADIAEVAAAAGLDRFFLYGMSQGAAYSVAFAARYPERVHGLLILGGRGIGSLVLGDAASLAHYQSGLAVIRSGWDAEDPSYRRYFTGRLIPDAWPELAREYDDLQRLSLPPANVEAYWEFAARLDVRAEAARLRVPALVLHCRGDRMVPLHAGRALAAAIPGARWIELEGDNHLVIPGTAAFERALSAMEAFIERVPHGDIARSDSSGPSSSGSDRRTPGP